MSFRRRLVYGYLAIIPIALFAGVLAHVWPSGFWPITIATLLIAEIILLPWMMSGKSILRFWKERNEPID